MGKFYSTTLQKGSQGDEVKEWQKFLNSQGYSLGVDGDFGDKTYAATTEWQRKNGLGDDGIVGEKTWGKAGYAPRVNYNSSATSAPNVGNAPSKPTFNTNATATPNVGKAPTGPTFNTTATATPESKPLPNAPTYDSSSWDDTSKGQQALGDYNAAKDKVNKYGDFTYEDYMESEAVKGAGDALNAHNANKPGEYQSQWQTQLDGLMSQIMNREKFSYDLNGDALYQQYKDNYIQQGKLAMADTMGQAAAMTGGYGNSYAQSVGQQAYQGQLDNLNDIVPELYAMALDKYNREGQELYNQYGMVMDRENTDYGRYRDSVSDWMTDRGYLTDRYDTERGFDYGKYVDDRNMDYTLHQDGYQKLLDSLGIAKDDYYSGADMFHSEQATKNSVEGQIFNDAMSLWGVESDEAWKKYQASEDARQYANSLLQQGYQNEFGAWEANSNNAWKEYQASEEARQYANSLLQQGYQNEFGEWEANTDNAWKQAQWDEAARQYANEESWRQTEWDEDTRRYEESKVTSSGNGGNGGNKGVTPSGVEYDNGSVPEDNIKKMQEALGVDADGAWGPKSKEAANGMSADEAWKAYQEGKLGKKESDTTPTGYSGTDYSAAVEYCKKYGVPSSHASGIMTRDEWARRKSSYQTTGIGGTEVKNYASYKDYLADITAYLIEKYN